MMPYAEAGERRTLIAEFNSHELFYGWWLYERRRRDRHNADSSGWGWLRDECGQQKVRDLVSELGYDPPPVARYSQEFATWFGKFVTDVTGGDEP